MRAFVLLVKMCASVVLLSVGILGCAFPLTHVPCTTIKLYKFSRKFGTIRDPYVVIELYLETFDIISISSYRKTPAGLPGLQGGDDTA